MMDIDAVLSSIRVKLGCDGLSSWDELGRMRKTTLFKHIHKARADLSSHEINAIFLAWLF